jgi:hypothetical protein
MDKLSEEDKEKIKEMASIRALIWYEADLQEPNLKKAFDNKYITKSKVKEVLNKYLSNKESNRILKDHIESELGLQ